MIGCEEIAFIEDEVKQAVAISASPGFTWGRSGNCPNGTFLLNDSVPSNVTGRYVFLNNAKISKVFVANELVSTFNIEVYTHEGNGVNLTLIGSFSIVADIGDSFDTSISVPTGKQLATRVAGGSAKNPVVGVIINGSLSA